MANSGLDNYWRNKYLNDLASWNVTVPEGLSYAEIKALHAETKKSMKALDPGPNVPHLNTGAITQDMLEKAVEAYLKKLDANKPQEPVVMQQQPSWMTKEEMKSMLLSVKEGTTDSKGRMRPGYIPPDDRIPTQKFFAPYVRYYVPEKFTGSIAEALPLNMEEMLQFKTAFGYTVRTGDSMGRKFVSILDVNSLSVYKWLTGEDLEGKKTGEAHPDFGRMFYKSANRAIDSTDNTLWAQTFKRHEHALSGKKFADLMTLATQHGIQTTHEWNNDQYRAAIAEKMTDNEFSVIKAQQEDSVKQRQAEALLLRTEGHNVTAVLQ